jgi:hypothetical protein
MRVFLAVVVDLFNFVFRRETDWPELATPHLALKGGRDYRTELPLTAVTQHVGDLDPKPIILPERQPEMAFGETSQAYVTVPVTKVFIRPLYAFDTVISKISFGEAIIVFDYSGRFARVKYKDITGWVLKDDVTFDKNSVLPNLQSDTVYLANDGETRKLRTLINDEFFASELYLPLLGVEYVYYRLLINNRQIPWGAGRPREAGQWKNLLRGQAGVKIGIQPKTGSIMEYFTEEGEGKISYVEAVHPDDSVVLTSVGRLKEGQYLNENLTKDEWQIWGPVWIQLQ